MTNRVQAQELQRTGKGERRAGGIPETTERSEGRDEMQGSLSLQLREDNIVRMEGMGK